MFGLKWKMIGGGIAALAALLVSWMRRGQKLQDVHEAYEAKEAKDEIVDDMERSVPQSFHIDRVLAERASGGQADSDTGSE